MSNIERYQLTPAWHVIDTHDESDPGMGGREMAAAISAADGEAIVAALNNHRGAVDLLREAREYVDAAVEERNRHEARALLGRIDAALPTTTGGQ